MLGSLMSMLGSPQVSAVVNVNTASNPSPSSSTSSNPAVISSEPTSNSTAIDLEGGCDNLSPNTSGSNLSNISPFKEKRDNSMSSSSYTSSSDIGEQNLSLYLKHNIHAVNLDDPGTQKTALRYLLEKVRDMESLLIGSVKENKVLRDEVTTLYQQNDVLAAENVTLKDVINTQGNDNRMLSNEIVSLKATLNDEQEKFLHVFATTCEKISMDMRYLEDDIDYLDTHLKAVQVETAVNSKVIIDLEKELTVTNQYNRRPNLIIDGIPDNILQDQLENVCLDIIHKIGFLPVGNYEVVACHRLKKKEGDTTQPTIIRFVNRKITEYCLKNRWKLKKATSWNLSFREDLCDANMKILEECEKLKRDGVLSKLYTRNGFVKIATLNKPGAVKVTHFNDIKDILSRK